MVVQWNSVELPEAHHSILTTVYLSRAVAIVHTCMYDAWAAYDDRVVGTKLAGVLRRPASERTLANKEKAISCAAYRAPGDVSHADTESVSSPLMKELGYDPNDNSTDIETLAGIGNVACGVSSNFGITTSPISLATWRKARTPTGRTSGQSTARVQSRCAFQ
ncbi:MAG: hypothetical protein JO356_14770 [Acidobacteria bacterium]|nr:hypothetical protein [Acidobacteriota bacterium]